MNEPALTVQLSEEQDRNDERRVRADVYVGQWGYERAMSIRGRPDLVAVVLQGFLDERFARYRSEEETRGRTA